MLKSRDTVITEWTQYSFNDLLEEVNIKNKNDENYPVLSVTQGRGVILQSEKYKKEIASENKTGYKIVPKGSIVFNPNYLNFGAIGVQETVEYGLVSSIYGVFKVKRSDLIDYNFLKHLIRSSIIVKEYNKFANGSSAIVLTGELHGMHVRLSVSIKDFKKIKWSLPSLKEQQKIAEILSTIDEQIENTEQLIEKTKELKKGLMQQLLTKGIGHTEFKQTELGEIPVGWGLLTIEGVASQEKSAIKIGPFGSQLKKEFFVPEGYKVYGQENVFVNDFNLGGRFINSEKFNQLISCELKPGDFVITMMGTIGKCAVIPEGIKQGVMDSHLLRIRLNKDLYCNELLLHVINSDLVQKQIKKLSVGGIMAGLSSKVIRQIQLPVPSIKEQQKIASILSSVDEQIESYEQEKEKYLELKKGLMQQLLTGKIRVTV